MCGIIGIVANGPVNQILYDGLLVLQHRGQNGAGIATADDKRFHLSKGSGLVRDVFRTRDMCELLGNWGIGHCRYPTSGSPWSAVEAQPFYVNSPFGIMLAHNGNLTNSAQLKKDMFLQDLRHINTESDSEVLLNVLAHELQAATQNRHQLDPQMIFAAVTSVQRRIRGAYAVVAMIAGHGLLAFRDPYGIRPLIIGKSDAGPRPEYIVCSESVAIDTLGFQILRDMAPGEAVLIDLQGKMHSRLCATNAILAPCLFEYVYLARPDSLIDKVSVYEARVKMGEYLAESVRKEIPALDIDVVIPIPDSSRPAALSLAAKLDCPYREGYVKNRYIGRTFIMPGQKSRQHSVRQKLNVIAQEFRDKNVLLVDDSIVRGNTSREIISLAREAGAGKVYFASASPPVRYANVYGIDMPTRSELIAAYRTNAEVCQLIGADALIYQELEHLKASIQSCNRAITQFDASCFDGNYVTGDITVQYLERMEKLQAEQQSFEEDDGQLDLNLVA